MEETHSIATLGAAEAGIDKYHDVASFEEGKSGKKFVKRMARLLDRAIGIDRKDVGLLASSVIL